MNKYFARSPKSPNSQLVATQITKNQLTQLIKEVVRKETRACWRVHKAVVTAAPNGSVCGVRLVGDTTVLMLPYSSAVASVSVGDMVLVATMFGSLSNAIVWQTPSFEQ